VENLPLLRQRMSSVIDNYLNVQQDVLETFIDRGDMRKLAAPTVLDNGKRIPGVEAGPSAIASPDARTGPVFAHCRRRDIQNCGTLSSRVEDAGL
jgi:hypothetical protein